MSGLAIVLLCAAGCAAWAWLVWAYVRATAGDLDNDDFVMLLCAGGPALALQATSRDTE